MRGASYLAWMAAGEAPDYEPDDEPAAARVLCPRCKGSGGEWAWDGEVRCLGCDGAGTVPVEPVAAD